MSKVKSDKIPHYELLYLISNKFSEDELNPIIETVKKLIKNEGGNITLSEDWGKRYLAYPIKGFNHGYYNLIEFDIDGEKISKINRELTLKAEILRHQIVIKKVKTIEEIEKDKKIAEKIAAKTISEEGMEKAKVKDMTKVDLKDLDEKLDKILEDGNLL